MQNEKIESNLDLINSITQKVNNAVEIFYSTYDYEKNNNIEIKIVDDLTKAHLQLRPDIKKSSIDKYSDQNGRLVTPVNGKGVFCVLININSVYKYTMDGTMTCLGTIAHELTHAHDYIEAYNFNPDISETSVEFNAFQLWSEFHARRNGYKFLRTLLMEAAQMSKEEQIQHIIKTELPTQHTYFINSYNDATLPMDKIYELMQNLGRLSVWKECFPLKFTDEYINKIYNNEKIVSLLNLLCKIKTVNDVFENIDLLLNGFDDLPYNFITN